MVGESMELPATLVFERPTARQIACLFSTQDGHSAASLTAELPINPPTMTAARESATTSSSLQLSRASATTTDMSHLCLCAFDAVGEVPSQRWESSDDMLNLAALTDKALMCVRHGAFMGGIEHFDNSQFSISPAEVIATDPQQRLLLERGYVALHAAAQRK